MKLKAQLAEGFGPLVDLVYPPRCLLCGEGIAQQGGLCTPCWSTLAIPSEPACATCGRPFASDRFGDEVQCAPCMVHPPKHDGISAGTLYNDASRKLVLAFKHGGKIGLAPLLARLIAARLPSLPQDSQPPLIVPVPLHRWRLWRRGYNQAGLLARELAKFGAGELLVDGLVRSKATPSLGGLGHKERARVLSGSINANASRKKRIKQRAVILVDDVLTSGATSDACVKVLKQAGAQSVRVACFARVLDEALEMGDGNSGGINFAAQSSAAKNETPEVPFGSPGAT
ncbi:MAG: ComF family protein [Erythrobacter sp.]